MTNAFLFGAFAVGVLLGVLSLVEGQELHPNARCNPNPDRGTCKENFTVAYYYDRWSHSCRPFYFSGCGGNENRFVTQRECTATCPYQEPLENTARHRCSLPHDPGNCHADIERWYFDPVRKRCVCSWWSGCGGNDNRYYSYPHCMEICGQFAVEAPEGTIEEDAELERQKKNEVKARQRQQRLAQAENQRQRFAQHAPESTHYRQIRLLPGDVVPVLRGRIAGTRQVRVQQPIYTAPRRVTPRPFNAEEYARKKKMWKKEMVRRLKAERRNQQHPLTPTLNAYQQQVDARSNGKHVVTFSQQKHIVSHLPSRGHYFVMPKKKLENINRDRTPTETVRAVDVFLKPPTYTNHPAFGGWERTGPYSAERTTNLVLPPTPQPEVVRKPKKIAKTAEVLREEEENVVSTTQTIFPEFNMSMFRPVTQILNFEDYEYADDEEYLDDDDGRPEVQDQGQNEEERVEETNKVPDPVVEDERIQMVRSPEVTTESPREETEVVTVGTEEDLSLEERSARQREELRKQRQRMHEIFKKQQREEYSRRVEEEKRKKLILETLAKSAEAARTSTTTTTTTTTPPTTTTTTTTPPPPPTTTVVFTTSTTTTAPRRTTVESVEGDYSEEEDDDYDDLFFWKPEYEKAKALSRAPEKVTGRKEVLALAKTVNLFRDIRPFEFI